MYVVLSDLREYNFFGLMHEILAQGLSLKLHLKAKKKKKWVSYNHYFLFFFFFIDTFQVQILMKLVYKSFQNVINRTSLRIVSERWFIAVYEYQINFSLYPI